MQGAEVLIEYLQNSIVDAYDSKVDILGILPFLSKRSASVDKEILDAASEELVMKISLMQKLCKWNVLREWI